MDNFNNNSKNINYPLIIFIALQTIFVIMVGISIASFINKSDKINEDIPKEQPQIIINNLKETFPDFPSTWVDHIQNQLLDIVQTNVADVNMATAKAEIRSGTANSNYFSFEEFYAINAIVDIPELSQSYQLFFEYSNEENNQYVDLNYPIVFLCITNPDEIIYPDFNCTDIYGQKTRQNLVAKYLWFYEFDQFRASLDEENLTQVWINPYDLDDIKADLFIEETKQAIKSLGASPDDFEYNVIREEMDYTQDT